MSKKISELTAASALAGTELVEIVQGGVNFKATAQAIADLGGGGGGSGSSGQLAGINDQTGTAYTLALTDKGKDVRCTNAAAITVTVPPNSAVAFPVGTLMLISQGGAGVVTVAAGAGVTLNAANGSATTAQYDLRGLEKVAADTWRVI